MISCKPYKIPGIAQHLVHFRTWQAIVGGKISELPAQLLGKRYNGETNRGYDIKK